MHASLEPRAISTSCPENKDVGSSNSIGKGSANRVRCGMRIQVQGQATQRRTASIAAPAHAHANTLACLILP
jgi:hypothetical protein